MKFVPEPVSRKLALQILKTKKHSPTILFAAGITGVVATAVMASKATLKLEATLEEAELQIERVRSANIKGYSEEDRRKDLTVVYGRNAVAFAKLYAPAVIVGVGSIVCLTQSHRILTKRNAALTAAYAAVDKAFREYRERVVADVGEEYDKRWRYGTESVEVVNPETGEKEVGHKIKDPSAPSQYAVLWDQVNSSKWKSNMDSNQVFIKSQQMWANDLLKVQGFVFLNDVYKMLGIEPTKAGQIVGWVWGPEGKDNYIDFGVFKNGVWQGQRFVAGDAPGVWMDFNVDGNILDLI